MEDKEIIIDGVNAAECEFLSKEHSFTNPKGQCKIKLKDCKFINNCQYKQLKRSEQENAELKAENDKLKEKIIKLSEEKGHLIVENNTLKKENFDYNIACTRLEEYGKCLKQTLQEIKARIPEDYKIYQWYEDVIHLITKAESEG